MIVAWTDDGWNDYVYWYDDGDYKKVSRINDLVKDMKRHPFTGIGKPEPLREIYQGYGQDESIRKIGSSMIVINQ